MTTRQGERKSPPLPSACAWIFDRSDKKAMLARTIVVMLLIQAVCLQQASAAVTSVEVTEQGVWLGGQAVGRIGPYERLQGKVGYTLDPEDPADARIADLKNARRGADGKVHYSGDFVVLRPVDAEKSKPVIFLEVPNRGRTEADFTFFSTRDQKPFRIESLGDVSLDDAFLFEQGYTVAWVGWESGLPNHRISIDLPIADVHSLVRQDSLVTVTGTHEISLKDRSCANANQQGDASLTLKHGFEDSGHLIDAKEWQFATQVDGRIVPDLCSIYVAKELESGALYEAVYEGGPSKVAGAGLAAVRDFAAYLRFGGPPSALNRLPNVDRKVIGFGYSQSARFLRQFLYDGFNRDESGRKVFDGMFIASAGAGRGSFNHRYAEPSDAGTSVLSDLRPVDLFPFSDMEESDPQSRQKGGLLTRAAATGSMPKIFYTYSSTEYWSRFGALLHSSTDGAQDLPLADTSRLYFFAGTPHAITPFPPSRHVRVTKQDLQALANAAPPDFGFRALLIDLEDWVTNSQQPPDSVYPTLKQGLVSFKAFRFPALPGIDPPADAPINWRLDFGPAFGTSGVASHEPPLVGAAYPLLVPKVDADGNDLGGVRLPFISVPLGTYTGWNHEIATRQGFHYLAGLTGGFVPFPRNEQDRASRSDPRESVAARYAGKEDYLSRVRAAAQDLVTRRFLREEDLNAIQTEAGHTWDFVMAPD